MYFKQVLKHPKGTQTYGAMQKVNKVFMIGSQTFARGTSLQSYNEFVGSRSGVNFIVPCELYVLCKDSFFSSALRSAMQMSISSM